MTDAALEYYKNNSIKPSKVKFPVARPVTPPGEHAASVAHVSVGAQYGQVAVMGTYATDLASNHRAAQLIERLGWAVTDAKDGKDSGEARLAL